eukprot:Blabericola_migrator_1__4554@NODE_2422_length_2784_cov_360_047479_g1517_i0_p2_GENE_NODE_2422_length_2784_cov_360_047479_g1517_i0NODE_2422_length_2784_cov_360_047479_g1517_i0_p2_ORF_typecomplete_len305_score47_74Fboxlike/PF12937_7/0_27Fboxlike/PF12937_7/4e03_NODE_2422_length_2784_cov_360_047479_g1517_i07001614
MRLGHVVLFLKPSDLDKAVLICRQWRQEVFAKRVLDSIPIDQREIAKPLMKKCPMAFNSLGSGRYRLTATPMKAVSMAVKFNETNCLPLKCMGPVSRWHRIVTGVHAGYPTMMDVQYALRSELAAAFLPGSTVGEFSLRTEDSFEVCKVKTGATGSKPRHTPNIRKKKATPLRRSRRIAAYQVVQNDDDDDPRPKEDPDDDEWVVDGVVESPSEGEDLPELSEPSDVEALPVKKKVRRHEERDTHYSTEAIEAFMLDCVGTVFNVTSQPYCAVLVRSMPFAVSAVFIREAMYIGMFLMKDTVVS